jgi:hypothetical protein
VHILVHDSTAPLLKVNDTASHKPRFAVRCHAAASSQLSSSSLRYDASATPNSSSLLVIRAPIVLLSQAIAYTGPCSPLAFAHYWLLLTTGYCSPLAIAHHWLLLTLTVAHTGFLTQCSSIELWQLLKTLDSNCAIWGLNFTLRIWRLTICGPRRIAAFHCIDLVVEGSVSWCLDGCLEPIWWALESGGHHRNFLSWIFPWWKEVLGDVMGSEC